MRSIKDILDTPGADWSRAERWFVKEWLYEDVRLKHYLKFTLFSLHHFGTVDNTEDTWTAFVIDKLDDTINKYDPAQGNEENDPEGKFDTWLLGGLKFFCKTRLSKYERYAARQVPLIVEKEGEEIEIVLIEGDENKDPERVQKMRELCEILNDCLGRLDRISQELVIRFHCFNEKLIDIAQDLNISEPNAKQKKSRVLKRLRKCLGSKGFKP